MDLSNNQLTFSFSIERILAMPTLSPAVTSGPSSKGTFLPSSCNNYHLSLFNNVNYGTNGTTNDTSISSSNNRYQVNDAFNSMAISSTYHEDLLSDKFNNCQASAPLAYPLARIREVLSLPMQRSPSRSAVSPVNQLTHQSRRSSQLIVSEASAGLHFLQCHLQQHQQERQERDQEQHQEQQQHQHHHHHQHETRVAMGRQEQQEQVGQRTDQINFSSLVPFYKSTNYLHADSLYNSLESSVNESSSGGSNRDKNGNFLPGQQCQSPTSSLQATSTCSLEERLAIQSDSCVATSLEKQLHYPKRSNAAASIRGKHLLKQQANPSSIDSIEPAQYRAKDQVGDTSKDNQFDSSLQPPPPRASSSNKCRRFSRAVFTESQRIGLENAFQASQYIQKGRRTQLAESLGLTELQVKVWFQNRRMKWRSSKEYQSDVQRILSGSTSSQCNKKLKATV